MNPGVLRYRNAKNLRRKMEGGPACGVGVGVGVVRFVSRLGFQKLRRLTFNLAVVSGALPVVVFGVTPEISLRSSSDLIINTESREIALEVGRRQIASGQSDFLATLVDVKSPFLPLDYEEGAVAPEPEPEPEVQVNYSDKAILEAVASRFSKQVRGSLSMGDVSYLQIEGGSLIRPGTSFPASIPEMKGQTFEIMVESISSEAYVLALGEARVRLTYDRAEDGSKRIQFSD